MVVEAAERSRRRAWEVGLSIALVVLVAAIVWVTVGRDHYGVGTTHDAVAVRSEFCSGRGVIQLEGWHWFVEPWPWPDEWNVDGHVNIDSDTTATFERADGTRTKVSGSREQLVVGGCPLKPGE